MQHPADLRYESLDLLAASVRPGVRRAGLSWQSPALTPGQRRRRRRLDTYVAPGRSALLFTSPAGQPLRHGHFRSRVWLKALAAAELDGIHFHDLRHTGNDLAASTGADLRTLMDRMGHSTARAALIYQHRRSDRQQAIAQALSKLAEDELSRGGTVAKKAADSHRARNGHEPLDRQTSPLGDGSLQRAADDG